MTVFFTPTVICYTQQSEDSTVPLIYQDLCTSLITMLLVQPYTTEEDVNHSDKATQRCMLIMGHFCISLTTQLNVEELYMSETPQLLLATK